MQSLNAVYIATRVHLANGACKAGSRKSEKKAK